MRHLLTSTFIAGILFAYTAPSAFAQESSHNHHHDDHAQMQNMKDKKATKPENSEHKPWSMADEIWGEEAMREAREMEIATMGGLNTSFIMADRFELQSGSGEDVMLWDLQGWYGNDDNRLWIKAEGEYGLDGKEIEEGEIQALWSKPVTTFWDFQAGVRYDYRPKGRTHLVAGFQGLAPYFFEVDAAAFLSTQGDLTARVEAEYDMLLTQRLILQPRGEFKFSAQDIAEQDRGAGINSASIGVRLRYDIVREFSPYIGVEWKGKLGETRSIARAQGKAAEDVRFLLGVRAWY